jgi:tetratricopeptide (TPR) repeat protein
MPDAFEELLRQAQRARRENRPADAKRDLEQALEMARNSAPASDLARALAGLGQIERDLGNHAAALGLYQQAALIYRGEADPLRLAHTVRHVGDIRQDLRQFDLAEPYYREALDIYRAHPETPMLDLANAIRGLALLKSETGERVEARALWQEARDLYAAVNVEAGVKESTRRLGLLTG